MIRINQIKLPPDHSEDELYAAIIKSLRLKKGQVKLTYKKVKKSIDSRHKPDVKLIYSVDVVLEGYKKKDEEALIKKVNSKDIMLTNEILYRMPLPDSSLPILNHPPVIIGMGPAGLFCGLMLARAGYRPVILERGADVDSRLKDVTDFWNGGRLKPESNVQFGEGGAGTFSDGKLNTMIKDKTGRIAFVLDTFREFGADEEITYVNKPHIGTDVLHQIVKNIRAEIIRLGGTVLFHHQVTDLLSENGILRGLVINHEKTLACELAVLAIGHSARNTFEMLLKRGVDMIPKAFAVGVRVEHPQDMINENAYGNAPYELPPADYKVVYQAQQGRGVYSFCMCPGGYVVNASSEEGKTCINGMSYSQRDSENANSAIIVTVTPQDYGNTSPLDGMYFQRRLEEAAFQAGNGLIPMQTYGDFKNKTATKLTGRVKPVTCGGVKGADLNRIFPEYIRESIIEGMEGFAKNIEGFNREDTLLFAVESRTSSPVRILRDEEFMANIKGLIPCGEGAGYAGGITSAAIDGIKAFEAICHKYKGVRQ